jgi:hypothetical protein
VEAGHAQQESSAGIHVFVAVCCLRCAQAKPGFELKVKAAFTVTAAGDPAKTLATGSVEGDELCDYDGYDFELTAGAKAHADGGATASAVRPAGAVAKSALTACLKDCVSRMGGP